MKQRYQVLDGWRGISIACVLVGHLLPVGPSSWHMNASVASAGMSMFFILSGFLITNILLSDQNIKHFLIRRFMRIIPLAWLVLTITFLIASPSLSEVLSHYFFYANIKPDLTAGTSHFWSLCMEMQFYVGVALLVACLGKRGLYLLPLFSIFITFNRIYSGADVTIQTQYRVDEILAGCILALAYNSKNGYITKVFRTVSPFIYLPILLYCTHPMSGISSHFRSYIAMLMIGSSLYTTNTEWWYQILASRVLKYLATISYALYVIHGGLRYTWLASGDTLVKYLKRPLFFGLTFLLAHLSTFYFENRWIQYSKKLTQKK